MPRSMVVLVLVATLVAACGGDAASPSPSATMVPVTESPASPSPQITPAADTPPPTPAGGTTMTAVCGAIALRQEPRKAGTLVIRIAEGATVNVVGRVKGDVYAASACGTAGSAWLRIDFVDGVAVKDAYGLPVVYAAAGFFK